METWFMKKFLQNKVNRSSGSKPLDGFVNYKVQNYEKLHRGAVFSTFYY
jgi:hypothetical protein